METTITTQQRADEVTIETNEENQDFLHRLANSAQLLSIAARNSRDGILSTPARANTNTSTPAS